MSEFVTWELLTTYGGALAMVAVLTQLTKGLPLIGKLPTQIWSYLLALVVLLASAFFTGGLTASSAGLCALNAAIISLAANGGYAAVQRIKGGN